MNIRPADPHDAAAIAEIYNHAIATTVATWRYVPVDVADREQWIRSGRVFVAEIDGKIAGFAGYSQFRPAQGYQYTVENSVYIREGFHGRGLAFELMSVLIDAARADNLVAMIACIEAGNKASIALHEKLGFEHAGLLPRVGFKNDRFLDLALLQLTL